MRRMMSLILCLVLALSLLAGCNNATPGNKEPIPGGKDHILTVGMECAYAPYNWTQMDNSNGAVPIVNNPGTYANGYDVMIAKKIAEHYGWELEVMALEWDGLHPALNAGTVGIMVPVSVLFTIGVSRILYKKGVL